MPPLPSPNKVADKLPPTWQRLVLSVTGVLVIEGSWRWAVCHLYTLPTPALAGFVSITTNAFYVIGAIIIFMVTGKLVYEWKMGTSQAQNVISEVEQQVRSLDQSNSLDVSSNQPIGNLDLSSGLQSPTTTEVFVPGRRSPKDFLSRDLTI